MNIIFEKAKNGNTTCKIEESNKAKYLYSKYSPEKVSIKKNFNSNSLILFGLGLGYELKEILDTYSGEIYVIECEKSFVEETMRNKATDQILDKDNVHLYIGEQYKDICKIENYCIFYNDKVTDLYKEFYYEVFNFIQNKNRDIKSKKIMVFDHVTIARDCMEAFEKLGYKVIRLKNIREYKVEEIFNFIREYLPDYVFTINFISALSNVCSSIGVKYISWTVDIPDYSFYKEEVFNSVNYLFHFDEGIISEIKNLGVKNAYYLPQAANTNRLDKVKADDNAFLKYSCDASFVGNTIMKNEFNSIANDLKDEELNTIDAIFNLQKKCLNQNKIDENLNDDLVEKLKKFFSKEKMPLISDRRFMYFILSRKFDELQRISMAKVISEKFDFKVYGDSLWGRVFHDNKVYIGNAEHYLEMPLVFKFSKVNINLIRSSFESGLPMRVFDIMGSKGFMASSYKKDLEKFFVDGKDMVVYRDFKDLTDIIKYYICHEDERVTIAESGYEKVKKYHNYEVRLKDMMNIVEKNSYK
ncbi:hypothetical protein NL50_02190 [Clostridium acetobutylicum]|nr:hypothetical protein NL50_02190 [Clostridium acetobutylicum]